MDEKERLEEIKEWFNNDGEMHEFQIEWLIEQAEKVNLENKQQISDGFHTFEELYYHRMMLFSVICNTYVERSWKSWKHDDGTMFDDYFIAGIKTDEGQYTYHYHKDHWDSFKVVEYEFAPKWDGHKPEDITRLLTLIRDEGLVLDGKE